MSLIEVAFQYHENAKKLKNLDRFGHMRGMSFIRNFPDDIIFNHTPGPECYQFR
jgi:hypothetical protein